MIDGVVLSRGVEAGGCVGMGAAETLLNKPPLAGTDARLVGADGALDIA